MMIGTANRANASRALLLGSGELGKEIAISLQRLGIEVVAVDRYPDAPAMQVAHRSHVIDMTDSQAVHRVVRLEQPNWIIPELEAIATDALAEIEAQGAVTVVPNARAIQLTMNREGIRRLAAEELGLPTSRYAFASSLTELQQAVTDLQLGFPCFIKPTMSSSGKGQSIVKSFDELTSAWEYAKTAGRTDTGKVIVESKIDFDFEITLLTVRALDGNGQIQTYFCDPIGHRQESGDYRESWQPQSMSDTALQEARRIAHSVTEALGGMGLFGVELFVNGDQVWFSEVSPRPHDTGMVTLISQTQSEFDLHARAILGLPVDTRLTRIGASAVILGGVDSSCVRYEGIEAALSVPNSDLRLFGKPESFVTRRMGVALASADSVQQATEWAIQAAACVKISPDASQS